MSTIIDMSDNDVYATCPQCGLRDHWDHFQAIEIVNDDNEEEIIDVCDGCHAKHDAMAAEIGAAIDRACAADDDSDGSTCGHYCSNCHEEMRTEDFQEGKMCCDKPHFNDWSDSDCCDCAYHADDGCDCTCHEDVSSDDD